MDLSNQGILMGKFKDIFGIAAFLLLAACTEQFSITEMNANGLERSSIINGTDVGNNSHFSKSTVAIYDQSTGEICTGSLITKNIVLTAAHCVGPEVDKMLILFGTKITADSFMLNVDKVVVSKYWDSNKHNEKDTGDIALLHFSGTIPDGYQTIKFLFSPRSIKQNQFTTIIGYGVIDFKKDDSAGILRATSVKIVDLNFSKTEVQVDQSKGTGACFGDSGGPAFINILGQDFLWGVIARGVNDPENDCSKSSVITNILNYRTWIIQEIKILEASLVDRKL